MKAAGFYNRLEYPAPTVASFVERLERQLTVDFANADLPDGASSFGTLTASKRNQKPFIIGFIPPDNEINFIPVSPVLDELSTIGGVGGKQGGPDSVSTSSRYGTGNAGEQERVNKRVALSELRQAVYDSYVKQTGQQPKEATLRLLVSQVMVENGTAYGKPPGMNTYNYNLGNSHAGHAGTYEDGANTKAARKGKDPSWGIKGGKESLPKPSGGTYYLGTDYTGNNVPYPVWFQSFDSLQGAVDAQVNLIIRQWPGAATASTPEEYVNALQHTPGRLPYFGASDALYVKSLNRNGAVYDSNFGNSPLGILDAPPLAPESPQNPRLIMKSGYVTDPNDPLNDGLGRSVQVADEERQAIAAAQTLALRIQIDLLNNTPPLVLLINPSRFERAYEQGTDSSPKGRYGNIVHNWLERPFSIDCEGVTAGQYAVDAEGSGGLTNVFRVYSLSYANLLSLLMIYKNNGVLFAGDESDRGIPVLGMSVFIYYDEHIYIGSFDTFSISDSSDKPYNMSYQFRFNVRYDLPLPDNGTSAQIDSVAVSNMRF